MVDRELSANLLMGTPLPIAVVQIGQVIPNRRGYAAGGSDRLRGLKAPSQRAGIDDQWTPLLCDSLRRPSRLARAEFRQVNIAAAAEALRRNPFDMPVSHKDDPRHAVALKVQAV